MMKMVPKEEVTKLFGVLIMMLLHIQDDPCWERKTHSFFGLLASLFIIAFAFACKFFCFVC